MTSPAEACLRRCVQEVLPQGETVLLAVSGGGDSMALLALGARLLGGRLAVVHVQHGLRQEAESDARLVAEVCRGLSLPFLRQEARPTPDDGSRSETSARRRRMAALLSAAQRIDARWVATAHHLDDDLETAVLHHWRGHLGERARAGIPTLRPIGNGVTLLRPFLMGPAPPGRSALAPTLRESGLPWAHDASNDDLSVPRNRVRSLLAGLDGAQLAVLIRARARARARLQARVRSAAGRLALHLRPEGMGCRLDAAGWPEDLPDQLEVLRLLGLSLQQPRRMILRATVVASLQQRMSQRLGELLLPADPSPLSAICGARGLQLPREALAPSQEGRRGWAAVAQSPLYL